MLTVYPGFGTPGPIDAISLAWTSLDVRGGKHEFFRPICAKRAALLSFRRGTQRVASFPPETLALIQFFACESTVGFQIAVGGGVHDVLWQFRRRRPLIPNECLQVVPYELLIE